MKKIILYISLIFLATTTSCVDDISGLNLDTKHPSTGSVPSGSTFLAAETNLFEQMVNTSVNRNVFRLFAQQWTETTYLDESNYDITTRKIPDAVWLQLYVRVLNNLKETKLLLDAEKPISAEEKAIQKNKYALIELLNIYTYQVLVDTFGDIPYSESLDYNKVTPKYDDAKSIYLDLAKRLNAVIATIDTKSGSYGASDQVYNGDMAKWLKFANGLRIKLGINLSDADAASAKALIEAGAKGTFTSNADNATLRYSSSVPNTNPVWLDLIQSGRHDYVPANTIVDAMNATKDPRSAVYFTTLKGVYVGGPYAAGGNYTNFSQIGNKINAPDLPGVIMDFAEINFYLAEAAVKGMSVGGTAESFYNSGITASFDFWGATGVTDFLTNADVAYTTAKGTPLEKIALQSWIASYNRGFEAWTNWRRLDYPKLNVPTGKTYADIPVRFTYPVNEQTLNGANYKIAATAIGGDNVATKLFWDKK